MYAKLTAGDLHLGIARGCRRHRLERPCCACGCHTWSTISLTSATDLLELVNECVVFGVNWSDKLLNDRSCVNDYQVTYDSHDIFSRGGNCCARAAAAACCCLRTLNDEPPDIKISRVLHALPAPPAVVLWRWHVSSSLQFSSMGVRRTHVIASHPHDPSLLHHPH